MNKKKKLIREAYICTGMLFLLSLVLLAFVLSQILIKPNYFEKEIVFENITYKNAGGENPQYHIGATDNNVYKVDSLYYKIFSISKFNGTVNAGSTIVLLVDKDNWVYGVTKNDITIFDYEEVKKKDKENTIWGLIIVPSLFCLSVISLGYYIIKINRTPN